MNSTNPIDDLLTGINNNLLKIKGIESRIVGAISEITEHDNNPLAHNCTLRTFPIVKDEYDLRTALQEVTDIRSRYIVLNNDIYTLGATVNNINTELDNILIGLSDNTEESNKITTEAGRKLYRHRSNIGSVLEFRVNNQDKKIIIPDAIFRNSTTFDTSKTTNSLTNATSGSRDGYWYINNWSEPITEKINYTDMNLDDIWSSSYDSKTSNQNCEVWKSINTAKSIFMSRLIMIDNRPCCIPNIQTLLRIYCEAENIDKLDKSLPKYSNMALGSRNPNGYWKINNSDWVVSSTQFSQNEVRGISYNTSCKSVDKATVSAFIPILEL